MRYSLILSSFFLLFTQCSSSNYETKEHEPQPLMKKREAVYQKSDERQSAPLESTPIDSKLGHIEFVEEFLINYFAKIESPNFNAYEFYALEIDQYFTIKNTNPSFVNQEVRSADNDYQHKKTILVPHSVDFSHHDRDIDYYTFNVDFSCYRPSKNALQECEVFAQVGLNNDNKIVSYIELDIANLEFKPL